MVSSAQAPLEYPPNNGCRACSDYLNSLGPINNPPVMVLLFVFGHICRRQTAELIRIYGRPSIFSYCSWVVVCPLRSRIRAGANQYGRVFLRLC